MGQKTPVQTRNWVSFIVVYIVTNRSANGACCSSTGRRLFNTDYTIDDILADDNEVGDNDKADVVTDTDDMISDINDDDDTGTDLDRSKPRPTDMS